MSITNITVAEPTWAPVKIEMEFKTRDEYFVFLQLLCNPHMIADCLHNSGQMEHLSRYRIEMIIDRYVPHETYGTMMSYLDK